MASAGESSRQRPWPACAVATGGPAERRAGARDAEPAVAASTTTSNVPLATRGTPTAEKVGTAASRTVSAA